MKTKTVYVCERCSYQSSKWIGKCSSCGEWNSFREDIVVKPAAGERPHKAVKGRPAQVRGITKTLPDSLGFSTGISELDRVFGGGIVPGSITLLAGEPGIGKSTLTLQLCEELSKQKRRTLYIAGEESVDQISMRGKRLGLSLDCLFFCTHTDIETILATIEHEKPDFVIVDSIQIIYSPQIPSLPGSVTQVRQCAEGIMELIKRENIPTILIGHVTKGGDLAGPRTLEHLVDAVLYLEGDRYHDIRILRGIKNRFGGTQEVGLFEMREEGMCEVKNPGAHFISEKREPVIGSAISVTLEGSRPLLVEIQALTNPTSFGYPKRTASGFDVNRMNLLIAVIQKYTKLDFSNHDAYVNVVGGLRVSDPAADLAVSAALISSYKKEPIPFGRAYIGEVGLSGEVRNVPRMEQRIKTARKFGLTDVLSVTDVQRIVRL